MIQSKNLVGLAAGLAAGSMTNEAVLKALDGDNELMDKVLGIAAGFGAGSIVSNATVNVIKNVPILDDTCDMIDDAIGGVFDIFD